MHTFVAQSWATADENTRTQTHLSIRPGLHTTLPNALDGEMPADALLDEINCQTKSSQRRKPTSNL
jgi:hypothetical protein